MVQWLWDIVRAELSLEEKKQFLKFFTGSDRSPIGGLGTLRCILQVTEGLLAGGEKGVLTSFHTCLGARHTVVHHTFIQVTGFLPVVGGGGEEDIHTDFITPCLLLRCPPLCSAMAPTLASSPPATLASTRCCCQSEFIVWA